MQTTIQICSSRGSQVMLSEASWTGLWAVTADGHRELPAKVPDSGKASRYRAVIGWI